MPVVFGKAMANRITIVQKADRIETFKQLANDFTEVTLQAVLATDVANLEEFRYYFGQELELSAFRRMQSRTSTSSWLASAVAGMPPRPIVRTCPG